MDKSIKSVSHDVRGWHITVEDGASHRSALISDDGQVREVSDLGQYTALEDSPEKSRWSTIVRDLQLDSSLATKLALSATQALTHRIFSNSTEQHQQTASFYYSAAPHKYEDIVFVRDVGIDGTIEYLAATIDGVDFYITSDNALLNSVNSLLQGGSAVQTHLKTWAVTDTQRPAFLIAKLAKAAAKTLLKGECHGSANYGHLSFSSSHDGVFVSFGINGELNYLRDTVDGVSYDLSAGHPLFDEVSALLKQDPRLQDVMMSKNGSLFSQKIPGIADLSAIVKGIGIENDAKTLMSYASSPDPVVRATAQKIIAALQEIEAHDFVITQHGLQFISNDPNDEGTCPIGEPHDDLNPGIHLKKVWEGMESSGTFSHNLVGTIPENWNGVEVENTFADAVHFLENNGYHYDEAKNRWLNSNPPTSWQ